MRAMEMMLVMTADMKSSVMEKSMSLKDEDKRIKLANKFLRLIRKGDEGLVELCGWIEYEEISDACLLQSDYIGI